MRVAIIIMDRGSLHRCAAARPASARMAASEHSTIRGLRYVDRAQAHARSRTSLGRRQRLLRGPTSTSIHRAAHKHTRPSQALTPAQMTQKLKPSIAALVPAVIVSSREPFTPIPASRPSNGGHVYTFTAVACQSRSRDSRLVRCRHGRPLRPSSTIGECACLLAFYCVRLERTGILQNQGM